MVRVATYMSRQILVSRMLDMQSRMNDANMQVTTQQKSQNYAGIAQDSFRLVSMENMLAQAKNYESLTHLAKSDVDSMNSAATKIDDSVRSFLTNLQGFAQNEMNETSPEYLANLRDIQSQAAAALNDMDYYLNTSIGGRHLFSGGRIDTRPVELGAESVGQFSERFNGVNVTYPETRAATIHRKDFGDVDGTVFTEETATSGANALSKTYGSITAGGGETPFFTSTISNADVGNLTFDPVGTDPAVGTISSATAGSFSHLDRGAALLMDATNAANDYVYTVVDISHDGRTITVSPPPGAAATDAGYTARVGVPNGAPLKIEGGTYDQQTVTVEWPTAADQDLLRADGDLPDVLSGAKLYVKTTGTSITFSSTVTENIALQTTGYYNGQQLPSIYRLDESRRLEISARADDPAFEKAIRAMGMMAQGLPLDGAGNLDPTAMGELRRRIDAALVISGDAVQHDLTVQEDSGDMQRVMRELGRGQSLIATVQEDRLTYIGFLQKQISGFEHADEVEAIVNFQDAMRALEASYQVSARISSLSLGSYLR